jgi:hypothetical protein
MWRTAGGSKETSIPDARPRTANHLARRNHPSAQHSTHAAKRHSYNPTARFLTARDLVFHPFMDLSSSTVSQSVFKVLFVDFVFFVAPKYRWHLGFFLGLGFFRVWLCWNWPNFGYFGCDFGLSYVLFWFHIKTMSFFSVSPLGL